MALPNPGGEHGIGQLTDQTIDTRITNGAQSYLFVNDTATGSGTLTTTTTDVPGSSATFMATEKHLIKYTLITHAVSSVADDVVRFSLTDGSNVGQGQPRVFDKVIAAANAADTVKFVAYEIPVLTGRITRKWRVVRNAGTGNVQAFADSTRHAMVLVEDLGVIVPT